MMLTDAEFQNLKNYCKIDQDFDDDVLKMLVNSVEWELAKAISPVVKPEDFKTEPRFKIALMKEVKEEYYERGLTAGTHRYDLLLGLDGIINQLRSELNENDGYDGTNHLLLSPGGDQSQDTSTDQESTSV